MLATLLPNQMKARTGLLIVEVLNEKCTRQEKMFEVIVVIFLCGLNYFVEKAYYMPTP